MKKLHVLKIVLFYLMIFVFSCQKDHEVESITIIKNPNLSVVNTIYNHNHLSSSPCQIYGDNIITSTTGSNGESFISMISLTNSINSHINLNKKYLEFNKTYIFDKYAVFQNPNTYYVVDLDEKKFLFTKTLDSPNGQNEIRYSFGHLYYSCEENGNKVKIKKVEIQSGKEDIISEHILSSTSSQVGNVNIINDSINGKLNLCYTLFNEPSIGENTVYVKNVNNSESSTYQYSETSIDGFFTFSITSGSILLDQIGNTLICSETKTGKILWKTEFDYRSNIDRSRIDYIRCI
ncbi:MAG: hypothetical protein IPN97_02695 [Saprospiraceae bacterium]|nr:hypothetical protein [Saprospiraceae bacterium]